MSTATDTMTLDVSQTPAIPFSRLVKVELRKMVDTRAGRWLLISIAGLTALVLAIQLIVLLTQDQKADVRLLRRRRQHPDGDPAAGAGGDVGDRRVEPAHGHGHLRAGPLAGPGRSPPSTSPRW